MTERSAFFAVRSAAVSMSAVDCSPGCFCSIAIPTALANSPWQPRRASAGTIQMRKRKFSTRGWQIVVLHEVSYYSVDGSRWWETPQRAQQISAQAARKTSRAVRPVFTAEISHCQCAWPPVGAHADRHYLLVPRYRVDKNKSGWWEHEVRWREKMVYCTSSAPRRQVRTPPTLGAAGLASRKWGTGISARARRRQASRRFFSF